MTNFSQSWRQPPGIRASMVLLAGILSLSWGLRAGEPIQFTNGKILPKARQGSTLTREIESGPSEGMGVQGMDIIIPSFSTSPLNSKEEKRRKEAQVERQNWMILDQGELQEAREEDERFGIRGDSIEKEKAAGDIWFAPQGDDPNRGPGSGRNSTVSSRASGQSRPLPPGANRARSAPAAGSKHSEDEAKTPALSASEGRGAHISGDLNPRNLFGPERTGGLQGGEKSTPSFKDLFGGSASAANARNDRGSTMAIGGSQSRSSMGVDSRLDVRPPAALPAFAPASSGFFDSASRSPAGGSSFDQSAASSGFRSSGAFGAAAANETFSSRGSTFGGTPPPTQPSANQRARTSREFFERPKMVGQ